MKRTHVLALATAVTLSACISSQSDPLQEAAEQMTAAQFVEPYQMPTATLTDQNGEDFDLRLDTRDQLTLLFFGYTSCPDICPITMTSIARAVDQLEPEIREHVGVVFVTLDANRDDPAQVKGWLDGIDPTFVGVTGEQAALDQVLAGFGYVMPPTEIPTEGFYEVAHPSSVFLFTPERLARFGYTPGTPPEMIAEDLRLLSEVWWPAEG